MPELRVLNGPTEEASFNIGAGITTIGRAKTNSICIDDLEMSRQHAEVHVHREKFILVDLESSNGSRVNGVLVKRQPLQEGDRVQFGQTLLEFRDSPTSPPKPVSTTDTVENVYHETRHDEWSDSQDSIGEVLKAQSNLDVLYQSALATGSFQQTPTLLERILDLVFYWSSDDRGCILIRENDIDTWIAKSIDSSNPAGFETRNFEANQLIIEHVFQTREGVLVNSLFDDERFASDSSSSPPDVNMQIICAPILCRNGMRGVIYADRAIPANPDDLSDDSFQDQQLKLLTAVGLHAAVAIESSEHYAMLLQAERVTAVGNTMASLSHHIKNIFQSINGGSHLVEAGIKNQELELIKNGWNIVQRNQESLTQLVMDILYFGKPVASRPGPVSMDRLLEQVVRHSHRLSEDSPKVVVNLVPDLPKYWLDHDLVSRALQNILTFVFDSRVEGQTEPIRLSVGPVTDSSQTVVSITFAGSPLVGSELETMFDPTKLSGQASSRGIGMAVARKLLNEAGADVTIQAIGEQKFCFEIIFEKMHLVEYSTQVAKRN